MHGLRCVLLGNAAETILNQGASSFHCKSHCRHKIVLYNVLCISFESCIFTVSSFYTRFFNNFMDIALYKRGDFNYGTPPGAQCVPG